MYERGFLSEEPDYVKALEVYEKAASLNNADGYCLSLIHIEMCRRDSDYRGAYQFPDSSFRLYL